MRQVPEQYVPIMADICAHYFPDRGLLESLIHDHLKQSDTIRLAWHGEELIGFSIASKYRRLTPFYSTPINILYQRMLYLHPDRLYAGLGRRLLGATLRDLFGWFWPFKRFAAICRTQNPVIAKIMNTYNVAYPQLNQPLPTEIRQFAIELLPILGATELDDRCRLVDTLSVVKGMDCTDIWNRYLHRQNNQFESLLLGSAFRMQHDRIINTGAALFMVAYAKPMHFVRYIFK